jgi:hypothetical protein
MLTGESQFHISTPLGIEPRSLMTGSKWVDHWTSGTVCKCSKIEGSPPQSVFHLFLVSYSQFCVVVGEVLCVI